MSDIGLSGSVAIDVDPAQAALVDLETAAQETAAAITAMGDEGKRGSRKADRFNGGAKRFGGHCSGENLSRVVCPCQEHGGIDSSTGKVKALNETLGNTAAIITLVAAGAMTTAAGLDYMLAHTAANAGLSNDELQQMREAVLSLGKETGQSFEGLAQGYMKIHNFGFQGAEAINVLTVANKSAIGTGADVADTAEVLAKALHEYGMNASQAAEAMNTMHLMSQRGNMTLEQFDSAMGQAIGVAANLGVSLADVSAAEAALTQHGFDAAEGATQLKSIMEHIVNPIGDTEKKIIALSKASGVDISRRLHQGGVAGKRLVWSHNRSWQSRWDDQERHRSFGERSKIRTDRGDGRNESRVGSVQGRS